jgi:FkbM family methyltransferase
MSPDITSSFGHYGPNSLLQSLIVSAQNSPTNWLGQQFAQLVRKLVMHCGQLPIDVAVGPIRMRCYLRDNLSEKKFVFMPWRFDRLERQLLVKLLPRDGVFVDIGANVGIYSLTAATHMDSNGTILALEPNPPAHQRLCFNLKATRNERTEWPTIHALPVGVSDLPGEQILHLHATNLGGSSLLSPSITSGAPFRNHSVPIVCRPLQTLLDQYDIQHVDVLKIDIEGTEDRVLVPFLQHATESRLPKAIILENSEQVWKLDLPGQLGQRGYQPALRSRMNTVYQRRG